MNTKHHPTFSVIFAAAMGLGVALAAGPAMGQQQILEGHNLDNNLRVGSGGVNGPRIQNNAGAYQDAIVTGNVGGLGYFHGNIDYLAPGEFTGTTNPDDVFNFRLNSQAPTIYSRGTIYNQSRTGRLTPQPEGTQPYGAGQVFLRSGSGVTSGAVSGQYGRYDLNTPGSGLDVRRDDVTAWNARSDYGLQQSIDSRPIVPPSQQRLGLATDTQGRLLEITASPLTGIRQLPIGQYVSPQSLELTPQTSTAPGSVNGPAPGEGEGSPAGSPSIGEPGQTPQVDANGDVIDPAGSQRVQRGRISSLAVAPGVVIGTQLNALVDASVTDRSAPQAGRFRTQDIRQAEQQMLNPNAGTTAAKPGEDVYMDLLRNIQANEGRAPADNAQANLQPQDQLTGPPATGDQSGQPPKTAVQRLAEQFRETQRKAAEGGFDTDASKQKKQLDDLMSKLDYTAPPLSSLAGHADTLYNRHLQRAERKMADGHYFDAEDEYSVASTLRPDDPMAQIGRVNTEIAAGLYLSAARNLRVVLLQHPEIIAARYTGSLLPHGKRLIQIDDDLDDLMTHHRESDAPLLIAYLAYQSHNTDLAGRALKELEQRRPHDPLLPMLQRIWLSPAASGDASTAPHAPSSQP